MPSDVLCGGVGCGMLEIRSHRCIGKPRVRAGVVTYCTVGALVQIVGSPGSSPIGECKCQICVQTNTWCIPKPLETSLLFPESICFPRRKALVKLFLQCSSQPAILSGVGHAISVVITRASHAIRPMTFGARLFPQ